ncbi:MAG: diadenylate cyclase CdaA [Deltaproteobacteria bacterium]|nr:diadenylate cyclase CdaA [Deltaproteobacteria bacterium]
MIVNFLNTLHAFFDREISLVLLDLTDIVLVAAVLYYLLLILKGTRAMQTGIGLGLVFIVYQASKRLGLVTLYAMLDTFITSLVVLIIVIFQNDIRRALMRFGRQPIFTSARAALESQVIEEVVRAAAALAKKHIGALIVFERDAILDEFIESGTTIDAAVSKELLYSIFIPSLENPVHDGAVIIRDGRVWQAGAFLPLSRTNKIDPMFGTRHRAAVGLTEETDAVVVVVSEERGEVSFCFNGNIVRNLESASLRKVLVRLSYKRPKTKKTKTPISERISQPPPAIKPSDSPNTIAEEASKSSQVGENDGSQDSEEEKSRPDGKNADSKLGGSS